MDEAYRPGVKGLAWQNFETVVYELSVTCVESAFQDTVSSVQRVVEQRVSYVIHVYADLVRAAGLQTAFDYGHVSESLYDLPVGDGVLSRAVLHDLEAEPVVGIPAYIAGYGAGVLLHVAPDYGSIFSLYGVDEELPGQIGLGIVVLGYQQGPGGVLVDAVYEYAHAVIRGIRALAPSQIPGQAVEQGAGEMAAARVYHQSGRLVDHQYVLILISDVQIHLLGKYLEASAAVRQEYLYLILGLYFVVGLYDRPVDPYIARLDGQLYAVSGCALYVRSEVLVYAQQTLAAVYGQAVMLEHSLFLIGIRAVVQLFYVIPLLRGSRCCLLRHRALVFGLCPWTGKGTLPSLS